MNEKLIDDFAMGVGDFAASVEEMPEEQDRECHKLLDSARHCLNLAREKVGVEKKVLIERAQGCVSSVNEVRERYGLSQIQMPEDLSTWGLSAWERNKQDDDQVNEYLSLAGDSAAEGGAQ
jgi:MoxR-like ATPase